MSIKLTLLSLVLWLPVSLRAKEIVLMDTAYSYVIDVEKLEGVGRENYDPQDEDEQCEALWDVLALVDEDTLDLTQTFEAEFATLSRVDFMSQLFVRLNGKGFEIYRNSDGSRVRGAKVNREITHQPLGATIYRITVMDRKMGVKIADFGYCDGLPK